MGFNFFNKPKQLKNRKTTMYLAFAFGAFGGSYIYLGKWFWAIVTIAILLIPVSLVGNICYVIFYNLFDGLSYCYMSDERFDELYNSEFLTHGNDGKE